MADKLDIAFIILNYNIFDETVGCIDSLKSNIDTDKWKILVVDNASNNEIREKLIFTYSKDNIVELLFLDTNLGFAKGNNAGIDYIREKYEVEFLCCINNDTLLETKRFYHKLKEIYENKKVAVIGPKIFLRNGDVQPILGKLQSRKYYLKKLAKKEKEKFWFYLLKRYVNNLFIVKLLRKIKDIKLINGAYVEQVDIVLHGCFLIFTPLFFGEMKGFEPDTFLFREEEILYYNIKKHNLISLYSPQLVIKHLEDVSTESICNTNRSKYEFFRKYQIDSLRILVKKMEM